MNREISKSVRNVGLGILAAAFIGLYIATDGGVMLIMALFMPVILLVIFLVVKNRELAEEAQKRPGKPNKMSIKQILFLMGFIAVIAYLIWAFVHSSGAGLL